MKRFLHETRQAITDGGMAFLLLTFMPWVLVWRYLNAPKGSTTISIVPPELGWGKGGDTPKDGKPSFAELEKRVEEWVNKSGTIALLEATREQARAAGQKVLEDMRPDPEILRQPMTI